MKLIQGRRDCLYDSESRIFVFSGIMSQNDKEVFQGFFDKTDDKAKVEKLYADSQDAMERSKLPILNVALLQRENVDLNVSSTYYRNTQDPAMVPSFAHTFSLKYSYYNHPPRGVSREKNFRNKLTPITTELAGKIEEIRRRGAPGDVVTVSVDGGSGSGKTTIGEKIAESLKKHNIQSVIIPLDWGLKERKWRIAVQKLVTGGKLSREEEGLVVDLKGTIRPNTEYYDEEDFFENGKILDIVRQVDEFRRSDRNELNLVIPDAYIRGKPERETATITIKKGTVVIFDGKYANREELQPYYDLRLRLLDAMDRTQARFEIRSRHYNPDDADIQIKFYALALVPSYEKYDRRTGGQIHGFIDLREEDWFLATPPSPSGVTQEVPQNALPDADKAKRLIMEKFLKKIDEPDGLVQVLADLIFDYSLSEKKLALLFDEGLGGFSGRQALKIFDVIEELKKDEVLGAFLKNVEIVKAGPSMIQSKIGELNKEEARMFLFARNDKEVRDALGAMNKNVTASYIDEKSRFRITGFPVDNYYPLPEIVVATLVKGLKGSSDVSAKDIEKALRKTEARVRVTEREDGALIFMLLPGARQYETQELMQRYARFKELLRAA